MLNIKLALKVLNEINDDLIRVDVQLHRFKDQQVQLKYREQVAKLKEAAKQLYDHYKIILDSQK